MNMAEVSTGIIGAQKTAADESTAARNKARTQVKKYGGKVAIAAVLLPILYVLASWINGWLHEPREAHASQQPATQEVLAGSELGQEVHLQLSDKGWSEPVFVKIGRCITWNRTDPDDPAALVEAKDNEGPWHSWDDYQKLRSMGTVGDPAWFRYRSTISSQGLAYEIRLRDQCS